MDLTKMQWEAIDSAHAEGAIEIDGMARNLLLPVDALRREVDALTGMGLLEETGDRYTLTSDGEATRKRRAERESAAVKQATRTWQPR